MSAGKGDKPRPVDFKRYGENFDRIFRNQKLSPDILIDLGTGKTIIRKKRKR